MDPTSTSRTSETLLGRLRQDPTDQAAWATFVERYSPQIYGWCRHWHLQEADAQDVTQDVLVILARRMRSFTYDPAQSFRAWLKTVTQHAWGRLHDPPPAGRPGQRRCPGRRIAPIGGGL